MAKSHAKSTLGQDTAFPAFEILVCNLGYHIFVSVVNLENYMNGVYLQLDTNRLLQLKNIGIEIFE